MSGFDAMHDQLRAELSISPQKKVLVVEGTGDVTFLTIMLDKEPIRGENLLADWVIGAAGGKANVLRMLERQPDWYGLVDRDADSDGHREALVKKYPNLWYLPRFCLENFLVQGEELEQALARLLRGRKGEIRKLLLDMAGQLPHAVRHGSLWRAIQPLYDQLMALGFNGALLKFDLPSEAQVKETLKDWERVLDADAIFEAYEGFQQQANALSPQEQARTWVHGKSYWRGCVVDLIDRVLPGRSASALQRDVLRNLDLPEDLYAMFRRMAEIVEG